MHLLSISVILYLNEGEKMKGNAEVLFHYFNAPCASNL